MGVQKGSIDIANLVPIIAMGIVEPSMAPNTAVNLKWMLIIESITRQKYNVPCSRIDEQTCLQLGNVKDRT